MERGCVSGLRLRFEGHLANKSFFDIEIGLVDVISDSIEIRNENLRVLHFLLLAIITLDPGLSCLLGGMMDVLKIVGAGVHSMGRISIAS